MTKISTTLSSKIANGRNGKMTNPSTWMRTWCSNNIESYRMYFDIIFNLEILAF